MDETNTNTKKNILTILDTIYLDKSIGGTNSVTLKLANNVDNQLNITNEHLNPEINTTDNTNSEIKRETGMKNKIDDPPIDNKAGNKLVFDIETTGLPDTKGFNNYYPPSEIKYYEKSRVIEIAYIVYDRHGKKIKQNESLIKPDGFVITNTNIHKISTTFATENGVIFTDFLDEFYRDLLLVDSVISHNIAFDINVLSSECYRARRLDFIEMLNSKKKICTMLLGQIFMSFYKFPKLIELYSYLFAKKITQSHRALDDSEICAQCYFEMILRT